ncbi:hypothetical protein EWM64_g6153 [Hericium alpestre]|uniref:Stress-activated map kinase-interacting protein 1 n=1 Tax=Hericium alpestre TaxID=135208 RepID=A0A4Y9ZWH8_9AGAM|nr:hypothetical protein EWM64_g6153 [Hericium alpestre]
MSLLSDPDFLIHSLRLNYLRTIHDPYGSRLISLPPSFSSNPYIVTASLADLDRWPELTAPSSPPISQDEAEAGEGSSTSARPRSISGFPGANGLKYSQTILGPNRTGAIGMGVSGRRRSEMRRSGKRAAKIAELEANGDAEAQQQAKGEMPALQVPLKEEPVSGPQSQSTPPSQSRKSSAASQVSSTKSGDEPANQQQQVNGHPTNPAPFIPKFKGAEEMDKRRRQRMLARHGTTAAPTVQRSGTPEKLINSDLSSSDEEGSSPDEEEEPEADEFDDVLDVDDSMEMDIEEDDFDPEFTTTRPPGASLASTSDVLSLSASILSGSGSSILSNSLPYPGRSRPRLSPVTEGAPNTANTSKGRLVDSYFEIVTPPPPKTPEQPTQAAPQKQSSRPRAPAHTPSQPEEEDLFARQPVPPSKPAKSALSAMLATTSTSNPFSDLYSAISGRGAASGAAITISVFFPHAMNPSGKEMQLTVRRDATMEEVLGFALWSYWEEGSEPRLDDLAREKSDGKEEREQELLSAVGWVLRIAEDDGEVDEDFPPPDRTGKISKFNFEAYAVLEASSAQVQQNKLLESKIQRSPSRVTKTTPSVAAKKPDMLAAPSTTPATSGSAILGSTLVNSSIFPSSFGPSPGYGPQMFLRIRVQDTADAVHISTTIPVSATMYMQEALELVCRKRKLQPKEYALLLGDMSILIPLDRTVASLQGKSDLMLVKRSMLPHLGVDVGRPTGKTTDPNASIFKRISDIPETQYNAAGDYTAAYKKYTVFRKLPMLVGRHERVLAIDGAYIHVMPSSNRAKAVFDSGKTSSYHIKSVVACQQSTKQPSTFRFVVHRDGGNKRYDFEAENAKCAAEIVQTIKSLKTALERNGTVHKSRRSKHVE